MLDRGSNPAKREIFNESNKKHFEGNGNTERFSQDDKLKKGDKKPKTWIFKHFLWPIN